MITHQNDLFEFDKIFYIVIVSQEERADVMTSIQNNPVLALLSSPKKK